MFGAEFQAVALVRLDYFFFLVITVHGIERVAFPGGGIRSQR